MHAKRRRWSGGCPSVGRGVISCAALLITCIQSLGEQAHDTTHVRKIGWTEVGTTAAIVAFAALFDPARWRQPGARRHVGKDSRYLVTPMRYAAVLPIFVLLAAPLPAQRPADREALARLDGAIPPGVLPDVAVSGDAVARQLQRAYGNFAQYVRANDRRAAERALFDFDQAAVRRRGWGWPDYGMARVLLTFHERGAPALPGDGRREGETDITAAWRHLHHALERDSTLAEARDLLIDLTIRSGDRELDELARRAITPIVEQRDAPANAWIVLGRALRTELSHDSALAAFDSAAARGGDRSVIALERARTLVALGDSNRGVAAYWDGARSLTAAGRSLYRQDLEWIVSTDSILGFDSTVGADATVWLRRFWGERDAAALHAEDARLREHLRRWVVSHRDFRVPRPGTRTIYSRFWDIAGGADCIASASKWVDSLPLHPPMDANDPRAHEPLLDHRGFVYMRHGEPIVRTDVATFSDLRVDVGATGAVNNSTWLYWVEGAWRGFHFGASNTFGKHAPTTLISYLPFNFGAWMTLAQFLPEYQAAAYLLDPDRPSIRPRSCLDPMQVAVRSQRLDASVAVTTDSDSPRLAHPWNAALQFFALGTAADGNGRALVTFAIPMHDLAAKPLPSGQSGYEVAFRVVAWEQVTGRRVAVDTVRRFRAAPNSPESSYLTGWFEVPLGAGTWQVAVRAQQDDSLGGAYSMRRGLMLDRGGSLSLSDIVTGLAGSPERWTPDGTPFPLNALGTWREGSTVELYFEVRGLDAGDGYTTTLEVFPADLRQKEQIRVRFPDVATGALTPVRRSLALGSLKRGEYRLVVTIESGGRRAVRQQGILVVR